MNKCVVRVCILIFHCLCGPTWVDGRNWPSAAAAKYLHWCEDNESAPGDVTLQHASSWSTRGRGWLLSHIDWAARTRLSHQATPVASLPPSRGGRGVFNAPECQRVAHRERRPLSRRCSPQWADLCAKGVPPHPPHLCVPLRGLRLTCCRLWREHTTIKITLTGTVYFFSGLCQLL